MLQNEFDTVYAKPNLKESINNRIVRGSINSSLVITEIFKQLYNYRKRPCKILFSGRIDTPSLPFIYLICKWFKTIIVCEINEYPSRVIRGKKENFLISYLEKNAINGYTFISDTLIEYYKKCMRKGVRYIKLPMTVDEERFRDAPSGDGNYIFYAGSLSNEKDGILHLIHSFFSISQECNYNIKIAGMGSKNDLIALKELITEYNLDNRVELLGFVDKTLIPMLLTQASILVMPRPDSIQARGGFPSKLGEYLLACKPVICTNIGELDNYLTESEVYFISPMFIEKELALKILEIYNDYNKALLVAQKGYNTCIRTFTLKANTSKLNHFIQDLFDKE